MTISATVERETHPAAMPCLPPLEQPRTAVIGGGKISEQHLRALRTIEGVQLTGICDLSPALAQFTAERFGVAAWYTDYRAMLETGDVDVVHVLTPPATHDRIVRDCLENGHHVIVEKPIALSNAGFRDLWELAASKGLRLVENQNYRCNEPVQKLKSAISAGTIGAIEEIEVRMVLNVREGGRYADENLPHPSHQLPAGVIHEFISHLTYLLLHFLPEDKRDHMDCVRAAWRNHGGGALFKYDDLEACGMAGTVHGRIRFSSRQWPDSLTITVRGADGIGTAEMFHARVSIVKRRPGGPHVTPLVNSLAHAAMLTRSGFGSVWGKIRNRTPYEGLHRYLRLTYNAFQSGGEPIVGFRDMDRTTGLIDELLAPENQV